MLQFTKLDLAFVAERRGLQGFFKLIDERFESTLGSCAVSFVLGQFSNAASGDELYAINGGTSLRIYYGAGSPFGANSVVIAGNRAVPEPGSALLGLLGASLLAGRRMRRR